jgi:hypothetical protein
MNTLLDYCHFRGNFTPDWLTPLRIKHSVEIERVSFLTFQIPETKSAHLRFFNLVPFHNPGG